MDNSIVPYANKNTEIGQIANRYADLGVFKKYQDRLDENTLLRHRYDLACFAVYLWEAHWDTTSENLMRGPSHWAGVTHGLIEGFVQWMLDNGYAIGTVNLRLYTIRAYFTLAAKAGYVDEFEVAKLVKGFSYSDGDNVDQKRSETRRPGAKKSTPIILTPEQIALLKATSPSTPQGRRDKLLMCLLLDHGLRCGEVADLTPNDIRMSDGLLVFKREKVKKIQKHKLTSDTIVALINYYQVYQPDKRLLAGSRKDILGNKLVEGMGRRAITKRVQYLGQKILGISNLSAHDCRHAWVEAAIRGDTNIKALQTAGGWSSSAMPLRYASDAEIANDGVVLK